MASRPLALIAAAWLAACTPALDWRQVRLEHGGASLLFPCRPSSQVRQVALGAARVEMTVLACRAAGATFALGCADVADPARVGPALEALRVAALANLQGVAEATAPARIKGMSPQPGALRLRIAGSKPAGDAAHMATAVFAAGTRVYQASVVAGERLDEAAVDTFLDAIELRS